jgi:hypothetical protein
MAELRGGAIIPEIRLYCTLRWFSGGSYSDIMIQVGVSKSSFYRVVWITIKAIATSKQEELQMRFRYGQQSADKVGDKAVDAALALVGLSHQTNADNGSVRHRGNSAARLLMVQDMKLKRPVKNTIPSNPFDYTYKL